MVTNKSIALFLFFVFVTLYISYWASKRTRTRAEFYSAGGKISGFQIGMAIAGDFMSAASFLGITGLMYSFGYDGLIFAAGAVVGWPLMMILFAERLHNLGTYNFSDVLALRLEETRARLSASTSSIVIVILYLIAQMVGAGKLIELLFGLPYEYALAIVAALSITYVSVGGMLATTWVQIIKAGLLLLAVAIMAFLVLYQFDFDFAQLFTVAATRHAKGDAILMPGGLFKDQVQVVTILVSMAFGTLGLPHILMRLFTVPDTRESLKSAFFASGIISLFFVFLVIIGFGSIALLLAQPELFTDNGTIIGGPNMVPIHLAGIVGGDWLIGFVSAVAFATILAVVSGLLVAGSAAVSHDIYARIVHTGTSNREKELRITRITTISLGIISILLGKAFQHHNVAAIAALPMVVAASTNFPVLILALYWRNLTTRGAIMGAAAGLVSSVVLIVIGPGVWQKIFGFPEALFPYDYPGLFTVPVAFVTCWIISTTDRSARAEQDRCGYAELVVKAESD